MRFRCCTLIIACLIGLAGCGSNGDGGAKAFPTSGPDTKDLLVHGVVSQGHKPLANAQVWLELWPEDDDTKIGEVVDTWDSKPVITGRDGRYALRLDPDRLSSKYFNGDYLNFELNVSGDGKSAGWNSTVSLVNHRLWRSDDQALAGDAVIKMSLDVGTSTITVTDSVGHRETSDLPVTDMP